MTERNTYNCDCNLGEAFPWQDPKFLKEHGLVDNNQRDKVINRIAREDHMRVIKDDVINFIKWIFGKKPEMANEKVN